jgi:predicted component of type VI protein secretion system
LLSVLHVELDIVFNSADGCGRHSTMPDTLLTITVSINADSSVTTAVITSNPVTTELDDSAAEGDPVRPSIQLSHESRQPMAVAVSPSPLSQTLDLPTEGYTPVRPAVVSQSEMSSTLGRAEEAMEAMDTIKAWKRAIDVVKQVMDTVDPIAEV